MRVTGANDGGDEEEEEEEDEEEEEEDPPTPAAEKTSLFGSPRAHCPLAVPGSTNG